ncbi:uncharacterized protein LOC110984241 [Acanthaster planci]|uniref:Uncharacterized protein LOC110984241 n=1 Tax=Acanthaster planci TaxID=133434 RepID=A0A8B7Z4N5_ACAPL|nr:uncharacterized protein LOC110984241 [Acanthaster planci]XP_022099923.1 uncharacterized protein LOC110984241 [Acanthaster planci]XP_022099924.1 uncharacterized protein LOC110984241 [Acanthaster planci]XP_022099925.1 uncharacterized protein LOC110984241 [Acanthaster planci]
MGACMPCLFGTADDYDQNQPDEETRRKQQAEAAEKRFKQEESRGLADPEGAKKRRQQKEEAERKAEELEQKGGGENKLSWQVG